MEKGRFLASAARRLRLAAAAAALLTAAVGVAAAQGIPTGLPASPLFGAQPFTQPMLMFEEFGTAAMPGSTCPTCAPLPQPASNSCNTSPTSASLDTFLRQRLSPLPTVQANTSTQNAWHARISACVRPLATSAIEGRPPGEFFAHQRWTEFTAASATRLAMVYFQTAQAGARDNGGLRDTTQRHRWLVGEFGRTLTGSTGLYFRPSAPGSTVGGNRGTQVRFHPNFPVQQANSVWTFDGTMPPKLLQARYGEAILFRHYNALPISAAANNGFGAHTLTTHEHNGHNPAESDGFTAAFFFPGQFYDYHWPMALAGHDAINTAATDPHAGAPNGAGGVTRIRGDWRETMSTHWFHDHMLDFTAQNVYKGNAAMMNYYSAVDRGREGLNCHYSAPATNVNLCLPSGTALDWGNRDYDVNLLIADKAWDANGQLNFNILNTDGFLGDQVLVNWAWQPYFNVRARRYRFRILNGAVSRYFKLALVTAAGVRVPFYMVANDGNIMEHSVAFPNAQSQDLPVQGIAERYDIVVDFAQFAPGTRLYLVNLMSHVNGRGPSQEIALATALAGFPNDPAVGRIMEFRVNAYSGVDRSMNPADYQLGAGLGLTMIPRAQPTAAELAAARVRTFEFGTANATDAAPWTIRTDSGLGFGMDPHRVSAAVNQNVWEIWRISSGSGWDHPVHIHFEEGQIISRDGAAPTLWEAGARKDVYRVGTGPGSARTMDVLIRFREFLGTFVEHCHNTQHEDHSMMLRWDSRRPGSAIAIPTPIADWEGVFYEPSFGLQ